MLALTKNDKNTNINWYINFIWRYLKKSLVRSSFIILPSTILRTTSGGGKVSAGGSNPTGVAENGGTGSSKTATVNSTVLCVSGGYSAWDYPNLSLQIKVNGSWIECTSSNGTLAQEGGYGASNGRRHRAKLWYNSGPYRNSIIQEIYAGGADNDGAVTVLAIKG